MRAVYGFKGVAVARNRMLVVQNTDDTMLGMHRARPSPPSAQSDLSAIFKDLPQEGTARLRQPYIRWTGEGGHCARRVEPARRRQKVHPGDNFLCTCVRMPAENKRASARRRMHFADKHRAASPQTQWQGRPHRRKRKQP